jgi:hypothetical protein
MAEETNIIDSGIVDLKPRQALEKELKKTGPKPKELVAAEYKGIAIGREKVVVDPVEVQALAALGCTDNEIANWFGVVAQTLRQNFVAELIKGREEVKQSLRRAQLKTALGGNATMLIWLGKNILGQSDNPNDSDSNAPLPWTDE